MLENGRADMHRVDVVAHKHALIVRRKFRKAERLCGLLGMRGVDAAEYGLFHADAGMKITVQIVDARRVRAPHKARADDGRADDSFHDQITLLLQCS